jgi:PPM family protein phosphatase
MQFSVYQESLIGGRKVNQDRMGYSFSREALLLVLADGMGGHLRGEVAAAIALQTLSSLFQQHATPYVKKPERFLEEALQAAHIEIHRYRAANNLPDTPRTTVVACLIQHNHAIWAHCGDSRLYWIRHGKIISRTRDHSHIETLIARGDVDPSERASHPDRNKLYNCLGATSMPAVDVSRHATLAPGDVLMLCSDGLWSMLSDEDMAQRLSTTTIVRAIPDMLKSATTMAGDASDNATALAIMWQGGDEADATPTANMETLISTQMLPENQVSTIMQAEPDTQPEGDAFNEDEIEKAIEEIRNAIEKSSQLLK